MTLQLYNKLLNSYNSYEFIGFPTGTFSVPVPNYDSLFNDIGILPLVKNFSLSVIKSVFALLDATPVEIYLDFESNSLLKIEPHGETSYFRNVPLLVNYREKRILLPRVKFIKYMRRSGIEDGIFEFRVGFRKDNVPHHIPEFKEVICYLAENDLVYRGLFVVGATAVENMMQDETPISGFTANKYFLAFFDKGRTANAGAIRYNEAFTALKIYKQQMAAAVANDKGDVLI